MGLNDYHFVTLWHVRGTVAEVRTILSDAASLPRWWPSVYLSVTVLDPGDARGLGKRVELFTKGWLPYTLRWGFVTTKVADDGFTLEPWGDFEGRGSAPRFHLRHPRRAAGSQRLHERATASFLHDHPLLREKGEIISVRETVDARMPNVS